MGAKDIDDIAEALRTRHGCHTAILYGSHARGEAAPGSDYDVAGFAPRDDVRRIGGPWRSSYLDVFIYPESRLESDIERLVLHVAGPRDLASAGRALFGSEGP